MPPAEPQNESESSPVSQDKSRKAAKEESLAKNNANEPSSKSPPTNAQSKVLETAGELIAANKNATALSDISRELRKQFGTAIDQSPSKWFGHKTLAKFLLQNFDNLKQDGNFVSLDGKSQNSKKSAEALLETDSKSATENLPEIVAQICQITDFPRLSTDRWAETLKMLAHYAESQSHEHEFTLSECTIWVRDQLKEKEIPVARKAINCIVHWAHHGGANLDDDPPPTADKIREAVIQNAVARAGEANLGLTPEGQKELRNWLQGNGNSS